MVSNGHTKFLSEKSGNMKSLDNTEAHFPSYEKFNWLIHLQHVRGEINACKDLIEEEIKRSKGKNEFAFYKQGEIFREEGKLQDALESFQACLKLNREHSGYLKEVGKCLYEMRRFKLSLDAYLEAEKVSRSPDWQIYYYLGQCLTKLGDTSKAKEYAHKAVKIGKHEDCYALLVKILIAEGDLKSAIAVSNAAVESCPDSVSMQTESGLLFLKLGQSQHAFERLSAALALEPTYPKALLGIGCITQKHEEYDVALTKYKLAIHYEPDSVALWNNIGTCFYSKQKYVAAISCLKRALWIQPLNWKTLYNLGLAHLATSQPASAFNFICAAVNLRSDVPDCFAALGYALIELKDPDNAARAFRQALLLSPEDPYATVNAAVCCEAAERNDEAVDLMLQFEELISSGGACSPEIMELADKLSSTLGIKNYNDQRTETKIIQGDDKNHKTAAFDKKLAEIPGNTGEFPMARPTGDASRRDLEPDEV